MSQMKTGNPLSMMHASSGRALFPTWRIVPYCPIYTYIFVIKIDYCPWQNMYVSLWYRMDVYSEIWALVKKSRIKSATRITTLKFCQVWRFKYFGHEWKGFFIGFRTHQILAQNLKQSEASSTIWPKNIKTCLYESKFSLSFFMIFNSKSVNINRDTKLWLKNQGLVKKGFGS